MLTDKEIEKNCKTFLDYLIEEIERDDCTESDYLETLELVAKWARDKCNEWISVEDELPARTDFSESFIEQSDRLLVYLKNGDMVVGYFTVDRQENDSFFEDGAERFDFEQVIGWKYASQPLKQ